MSSGGEYLRYDGVGNPDSTIGVYTQLALAVHHLASLFPIFNPDHQELQRCPQIRVVAADNDHNQARRLAIHSIGPRCDLYFEDENEEIKLLDLELTDTTSPAPDRTGSKDLLMSVDSIEADTPYLELRLGYSQVVNNSRTSDAIATHDTRTREFTLYRMRQNDLSRAIGVACRLMLGPPINDLETVYTHIVHTLTGEAPPPQA